MCEILKIISSAISNSHDIYIKLCLFNSAMHPASAMNRAVRHILVFKFD